MRRFVLSLVLALFMLLVSLLPSEGGGKGCKGCHTDVYNRAVNYPFPHSPVKDDCAKCHIVSESGRRNSRKFRQVLLRGYYKEGLFPLERLSWEENYDIEVITRDRRGRRSIPSLLSISPSQIDDILEDDKTPAVIKNIVVEEIKPGVFVEASLKWETNKPTTFKIEYGPDTNYGEHLLSEKVFVKNHETLLTGLRHNKTYHYRIIAKDLFENHTVSEDHTFDTSKSKEKTTKGNREANLPPSIDELTPIRAEDGSVYLRINNKVPSSISLKVAYGEKKIEKHGSSGIAPKRFSGIDACIKCHKQGASHPVGIPARGSNVIIPDTLPTGEGGVMTCATCHLPHGGMFRYLARFDFKRDVCVLCHKDF